MMSGIRSTNTRPEINVRLALFAKGFRYRLHLRGLPGSPDIILKKHRAAIFVHGCFWHGHDCALFRMPGTRVDFWSHKIEANRKRDRKAKVQLSELGWRCCEIWQCSLRGKGGRGIEEVTSNVADWLIGSDETLTVRGA